MKDANLSLNFPFPPAGGVINSGTLDLGVDITPLSQNWRLGKFSLSIPALPNNTDPTKTITVTLQDSGDGGASFAETIPAIVAKIPGVAVTGSPAETIDLPLPPSLRGPIQLQLVVPAGVGDCTAAYLKSEWDSQE